MPVYSAIYYAAVLVGGVWEEITPAVLSIEGSVDTSGNRDAALAFGDSSTTRISLRSMLELQTYNWPLLPIKVVFSRNATTQQAFQGVITDRERGLEELTFTCEGYAALIRDVKAYSPAFHRRPVATKTTAASVEDPSDTAYVAGPINWLLWIAGGRPLEQDFNPAYANARFWYSLDQALIAPEWSWLAGENAWDEALKLVQASGGQLYQAPDGVIRYRQPYTIADGTSNGKSFSKANVRTIRERQSSRQVMDTAIVSYVPRLLRPTQDVVTDDTPRFIQIGETISFDLEPQWPIASLEQASSGQLKPEALVVNLLSGISAAVMDTDFSHTVTYTAQKVSITIMNLAIVPLALYKVTLRGQPIVAGEAGTVSIGSGTSIKTVCADNPYIQSREHAERLAHIYMDFYGDVRPIRTLAGCVFDPELAIGEAVSLSIPEWDLDSVWHVVVAIRHSQTGAEMELDVVEIAGLAKTSQHFIVGQDATGLTKLIGY
jgi:hypothetical protein